MSDDAVNAGMPKRRHKILNFNEKVSIAQYLERMHSHNFYYHICYIVVIFLFLLDIVINLLWT